jgi:hypothetical protein
MKASMAAGLCLLHRHAGSTFRKLFRKAALIEFGDRLAFQLVALVQEGQAEGIADIAENLGILRPGDDGARATSPWTDRRS